MERDGIDAMEAEAQFDRHLKFPIAIGGCPSGAVDR